MDKLKVILVQVIIFALVGTVVLSAVWWFLNLPAEDEKLDEQAVAFRLQASAKVYYSRLNFYTGVCKDIGAQPPFSCNESDQAYAIEVFLNNAKYFCVDSTGFSGEISRTISKQTRCLE